MTGTVKRALPVCSRCGRTLQQAADAGAYFARINPKGEAAVWTCAPGCDTNDTDAPEGIALVRAIRGE